MASQDPGDKTLHPESDSDAPQNAEGMTDELSRLQFRASSLSVRLDAVLADLEASRSEVLRLKGEGSLGPPPQASNPGEVDSVPGSQPPVLGRSRWHLWRRVAHRASSQRSLWRRFVSPNHQPVNPAAADIQLVTETDLFDPGYYLTQLPTSPTTPVDAVRHYLAEGWRAGLDPSSYFSTAGYLRDNLDVAAAGVNPLVHYLRYGKFEGRSLNLAEGPKTDMDTSSLLSFCLQSMGTAPPPAGAPQVRVFLPALDSPAQLLATLRSVLESPNSTRFRVAILELPDSAIQHRPFIDRLIATGRVDAVRVSNWDWSAKTLLGPFRASRSPDLVLILPGALVPHAWLDRLRHEVESNPPLGIGAPLASDGGPYSYPVAGRRPRVQSTETDSDIDAAASSVLADRRILTKGLEATCVYVRQAVLPSVELGLNKASGTGPEASSAFTLRAKSRGSATAILPSIYLGAAISSTPSASAPKLLAKGRTENHSPEPTVLEPRAFEAFRATLDKERLRRTLGSATVLMITHRLGGGVEAHVQDLSRRLARDGVTALMCRPGATGPNSVCVSGTNTLETPNLPEYRIGPDLDPFVAFLREMRVAHVHIHHLAGFSDVAPSFFMDVSRSLSVEYDVTLHDYTAVCPRVSFTDGSGLYCGEPPVQECERCIARDGSPFGHPAVAAWRSRYGELLTHARCVFVPHEDVRQRMGRLLPGPPYEVRPHPDITWAGQRDDSTTQRRAPNHPKPRGHRVVAVLGAISTAKGSEILARTARAAVEAGLPLRFVVVGYTDRPWEFASIPNVQVTGAYRAEEAGQQLLNTDVDFAWFPGSCPETHSFTLSTVFTTGLFPVAFDIGAIAGRIRDSGWGLTLPLELSLDPPALAKQLATLTLPGSKGQVGGPGSVKYGDALKTYYRIQLRAPQSDPTSSSSRGEVGSA